MSTVQIPLPEAEIAAFCRKWRIVELALFGSVLREDFGPESDIDVLVTFDEAAPWSLWDLGEAASELSALLGRDVDFVERKCLDNPFRREAILSTRRVIYAA